MTEPSLFYRAVAYVKEKLAKYTPEKLLPQTRIAAVGSHPYFTDTLQQRISREILPSAHVEGFNSLQLLDSMERGRSPDVVVTDDLRLAHHIKDKYGLKVRLVVGVDNPAQDTPGVAYIGRPMKLEELSEALLETMHKR